MLCSPKVSKKSQSTIQNRPKTTEGPFTSCLIDMDRQFSAGRLVMIQETTLCLYGSSLMNARWANKQVMSL